jgi:hypothetical protein
MLLEGLKLNYACEAPMLSQKGLELRRAQGADGQGEEGQEATAVAICGSIHSTEQ